MTSSCYLSFDLIANLGTMRALSFMRILDRYICRQVLATTIFGVIVLSFVLVMGNLFREIRPLLESGSPLPIVLEFVLQVLPFSLMFTLPWGFLTAVLLVFGRLSADNEFTAMRMSGLSLGRISAPVFVLAAIFCGLSYWINIDVAPQAKGAISELLRKAASHDPQSLLKSGQSITKFNGQQLLIDEREEDKEIVGMHLYQKASGNPDSSEYRGPVVIHAEKVDVSFDQDTKVLLLNMRNVFMEEDGKDEKRQTVMMERMPYSINVSKMSEPKRKANRFTNEQLDRELANPDLDPRERSQFSTEKTRRITFSLACLVFAFIGVPLAIQTRRKDTSSGFAIGIAIAALYFVALIFADLSRKNEGLLPHILLWMPNVIGVIVGIYFFRRTRLKS